jgi:hypothetical protein
MTGSAPGIELALPQHDVVERHRRRVHATPAATDAAVRAVTAREVPVARALAAVRSLPGGVARRGHPSPPAPDRPLLDQLQARGFTVLLDRPGAEVVVGLIAQMWRPGGRVVRPDGLAGFTAFTEPGFVRAAMSVAVTEDDGATWVVTETRVQATDPAARRAFGRYWLLIRPFSGLIRREWLRSIAVRAESAPPPTSGGHVAP